MKFRWSLAPPQPLLAEQLARELGLTSLLAQCLLNRGLSDSSGIGGFLQPRLKHLADPFLLPNMERAVERLMQARERKEPVVIFGDYDVDGVTSTAILLEVLLALGWTVNCYLPHRLDEGYGLSQEAVQNCLKKFPATLLVAVDCGSTSVQCISNLQAQGVDVIVLDHHQVASPPPTAVALVNPLLTPTNSSSAQDRVVPFTELCSVGLAFKPVKNRLRPTTLGRGRQSENGAAVVLNVAGRTSRREGRAIQIARTVEQQLAEREFAVALRSAKIVDYVILPPVARFA